MALALSVVLEAGRTLTREFYAGDFDAAWAQMRPQMRSALGSAGNLAGARRQVEEQAGLEQAVLDEQVETRDDLRVYRRVARFSKAPQIEVLWTFDADGRVAGFFVRPAAPQEARAKHAFAKTRLALPVGGAWTVVWGGRTLAQNYHASSRDQRFAFDLLIVRDGTTHQGDELAGYHAFGQPVFAPADGVIVEAEGTWPDLLPGVRDPQHPMGNHVVIDHRNGEYSFLCHLKQGSVKPRAGEIVTAGDAIGLCGNSGNTTEPHLHYHLQDTPRPLDGDGVPAEFSDYLADGERVERGMPLKGQVIARAPRGGR
jgi:murein DD-endopeptidase MepM/ murein hydrolase activator NlpD